MAKARAIAMYLPQYYPIPENDEVWGKGYTEWTCTAKAKPLFRGHYQPRIPADLGFYDLRVPETRIAQAELAKNAGIEGFMYWHYWFGNGKRLLERPFNEVLQSGQPDFPFCLGWANHSWKTSTWKALSHFHPENNIIVEQTYPGDDDIIAHFNCVLPAFKDKRYITVDEKPLFVVYAPMEIPNFMHFSEMWNKMAVQNGLKGVHFVGLTSCEESKYSEVLKSGYDSVTVGYMWYAETLIQSKLIKYGLNMLRARLDDRMVPLAKYDYKKIIKHLSSDLLKREDVFPIVIPQWDRSPRSGRRAIIYYGSTPELFKQHVDDIIGKIMDKPMDKRVFFVRSWNEWGEGNYIEPDQKFGTGYLDALREVLLG